MNRGMDGKMESFVSRYPCPTYMSNSSFIQNAFILFKGKAAARIRKEFPEESHDCKRSEQRWPTH